MTIGSCSYPGPGDARCATRAPVAASDRGGSAASRPQDHAPPPRRDGSVRSRLRGPAQCPSRATGGGSLSGRRPPAGPHGASPGFVHESVRRRAGTSSSIRPGTGGRQRPGGPRPRSVLTPVPSCLVAESHLCRTGRAGDDPVRRRGAPPVRLFAPPPRAGRVRRSRSAIDTTLGGRALCKGTLRSLGTRKAVDGRPGATAPPRASAGRPDAE